MEYTDDVHFRETFASAGMLTGVYMGKAKSGRWRTSGNRLCLHRAGEEERCYDVFLTGETMQLRPTGLGLPEEGRLRKTGQAR